jgi:hypothetical protein
MPDEAAFSQADKLNLSRYNQALSELEKQAQDGTLFPHEAEDLKRQVLLVRAPLLKRQEEAQQKAQQEQQQQLMQQAALGESIEQQHDNSRANGFPQTVAKFKHPVTGEEAYFYQSSRGQWDQIDFGEKEAPAPPSAPGGE